jgi:hypothetical protein
MARFYDRFTPNSTWESKNTPNVRNLLDNYVEKTRNIRMILASFKKYQVYEGLN